MKSNVIILILFFIFNSNSLFSQEAFDINWKRELGYIGGSIGVGLTGYYLLSIAEPITLDEYINLDGNTINRFDRIALRYDDSRFSELSDYVANGSAVLPLLVYASKFGDKEWLESSIMYFDLLTLNAGLVTIAKYSFNRHRPYLFELEKTRADFGITDSASFYSGHTSFAASNSFFAAALFQRAYPASRAIPYVYGIAATVPAITGYLRVRSGVHYPSDVIVGYAVGAAVAFAVIKIHARDDIELRAGGEGAGIVWTF